MGCKFGNPGSISSIDHSCLLKPTNTIAYLWIGAYVVSFKLIGKKRKIKSSFNILSYILASSIFVFSFYRKEICPRKLTRTSVSVIFLTTNSTNISSYLVSNTSANSPNCKVNSNNWNLRNRTFRYVMTEYLLYLWLICVNTLYLLVKGPKKQATKQKFCLPRTDLVLMLKKEWRQ